MKLARAGWPILLIIVGLVVAAIGFRCEVRWLIGAGWLSAGIGAGLAVHHSIQQGVIRTNLGTFRREDGLGWFRFQSVFWWVVVVAWTVGGVLLASGVVGNR